MTAKISSLLTLLLTFRPYWGDFLLFIPKPIFCENGKILKIHDSISVNVFGCQKSFITPFTNKYAKVIKVYGIIGIVVQISDIADYLFLFIQELPQ